ncbi:MAG: SlyX family protein [Myxococcales bacterium]|nr:SlyX family protein [Myxococcales bacterium]
MERCSCDARVTELEIRLTYQDELIETLNQVVIALGRELEGAQQRLTKIDQQLQMGLPDEAANEPPPHY